MVSVTSTQRCHCSEKAAMKTGHSLLTLILDHQIECDSNTAKVCDLLSHHLKTSTLPSGDLLQNSIPLLEEAHH